MSCTKEFLETRTVNITAITCDQKTYSAELKASSPKEAEIMFASMMQMYCGIDEEDYHIHAMNIVIWEDQMVIGFSRHERMEGLKWCC